MQILLVDDIEDTRDLYSKAFALMGHQAQTACSGWEALDIMSHSRFDAVVMDVQMPGMSGWQVLEIMRQLPRGADVPVVMFTAHNSEIDNIRAGNARAQALVRKPITPGALLDVIERVIAGRSAQDSTPLTARGWDKRPSHTRSTKGPLAS
jgi:CheY-like chemotaxis protein